MGLFLPRYLNMTSTSVCSFIVAIGIASFFISMLEIQFLITHVICNETRPSSVIISKKDRFGKTNVAYSFRIISFTLHSSTTYKI